MKNAIFKILIFIAAFIGVERLCHKVTHGFRIQKIHSDLTYNSAWDAGPLSMQDMEHIRTILSQPFYFLNSGGESYAFTSKDGEYVIKFFKHHHMRPRHWLDPVLPHSFRKQRLKRFNRFFNSCKLAFDRFKNETGLIYIHLNKTHDLQIKLEIIDPSNIAHRVNLDQLEFALQKKASMAYPTITALIKAKELDAAKTRLGSLVELITERCKAGIADHDAQIRNFAFIGEEAIEIDLGSFSIDESLKTPQAANKVLFTETMKLRQWINKNHPELSSFLDEKINALLEKK